MRAYAGFCKRISYPPPIVENVRKTEKSDNILYLISFFYALRLAEAVQEIEYGFTFRGLRRRFR